MTSIAIGSTIIGKSGKKLIVDRIDGDIIYSGEFKIKTSAVVRVIPPYSVVIKVGEPLMGRLRLLATLDDVGASEELKLIVLEFRAVSIYEDSLDLDTFPGIFIRRLLSDISSMEIATIGEDSSGKYGELTFPDSLTQTNLASGEGYEIGCRVTHIDPYHCYGADIGTIELVDMSGDYHVRWNSDNHIGRYSMNSLKPAKVSEFLSRSSPDR
jgi:hypothetical protein